MTAKTMGSKLRGCLPPTLLALAATLLITLSGVLCDVGEEALRHQCYWCGPLTELVHRRARAQLCGPAPRLVTCAAPYPYCATIAASPPYSESRICVKTYQDMCYPLFCNTTRVWKMVCPCKGDLCNGEKTQRETKAFQALTKLSEDTFAPREKRNTDVAHENQIQSTNITRSNCNEKGREVTGHATQPGKDMSMRPQSDQPADEMKSPIPSEGRIVSEKLSAQERNITAAAVHHEAPIEHPRTEPSFAADLTTVMITTMITTDTTLSSPSPTQHNRTHTSPAKNNAYLLIVTHVYLVIFAAALFVA